MSHVEGVPLNRLLDAIKPKDRTELKVVEIDTAIQNCLPFGKQAQVKISAKNAPEFFCSLIMQVADAVQYAHDNGISHRDIKPSNIIIEPNGKPVLLDFGLSHDEIEKNLTISGTFLGTPVYTAPEVFEEKPKDHKRLDVYSLAVTLFECLTGHLPFDGNSLYEITSNIKTKEPSNPKSFWKKIPTDLNTIIHIGIVKDPIRRYATAQAFRDDLQRFLDSKPINARPTSLIYKLRRGLKRNRKIALALFILMSCIITFAAIKYRQYLNSVALVRYEIGHLFAMGDFEQATNKLKEITILHPDNIEALDMLATGQISSGDYTGAIVSLKRLATIHDDTLIPVKLAFSHLSLGQIEEAEIAIQLALKKVPTSIDALRLGTLIAITQGHFRDALQLLDKIEAEPIAASKLQDTISTGIYPVNAWRVLLYEKMGLRNLAQTLLVRLIEANGINNFEVLTRILRSNSEEHQTSPLQIKGKTHIQLKNDQMLSLDVPYGFFQISGLSRYGKDIKSSFMASGLGVEDYFVPPSFLVAQLDSAHDLQAQAFGILDRIVVRFQGATMKRTVESPSIDQKNVISTIKSEIMIPLMSVVAHTRIVHIDNQFFMLLSYSPASTYEYHQNDFMTMMDSATMTNDSDDWGVFSSPDRSYTVKMPTVPTYFVSRTGNNHENHVLDSNGNGGLRPVNWRSEFMI